MSSTQEPSPSGSDPTRPPGEGTLSGPPAANGRTISAGPDLPPDSSAAPPEVPGRIGRFEVRRLVGEGAFGRVYEAFDPSLKRTVALKVAKPEQLAGERRTERFLREARAAAHLLHPHIVAVFDSGQDGAQHYIAAVFVPGRSLATALAGQALPLREAVTIVRKLAEALAYAHKEGVIHRDVKPGNVMLREDGEPLLMDFGLAAWTGEKEKLTLAGQVMGTPEYTAPEQWRGQAEAASDQYSLGCLFFELLTGKAPFAGGSIHEYLVQHLQESPPSPRRCRAEVPRDLETVCLKCLEKEPSRRYADCQELADDLRRWLDGEQVHARSPGVFERLARWAQRNPAVAGLTAAVMATLLLGAGVAAFFGVEARQEAVRADGEARRANEAADRARQEADRADRKAQEAEQLSRDEQQARQRAEKNEQAAREAQRRTVVAVHSIRVAAGMQAWREHEIDRAVALLDLAPVSLRRTWEHRHLGGLCARQVRTLRGHHRAVRAVAWSPDGLRIASAGADARPRIWDAVTGQTLLTLEGHNQDLACGNWSPDGRQVVFGGHGGRLVFWDAHSGRLVTALAGHTGWVYDVAFSPDGRRVASGGIDGTLRLWDLPVADPRVQAWKAWKVSLAIWCVAFSPDGLHVAVGFSDGTLRLWDVAAARVVRTINAHRGTTFAVCYSPDGRRLATVGGDSLVRVWNATSGQAVFTLRGHTRQAVAVAWSPDGARLASGGEDNTLRLWDPQSGQELLTLEGHTGGVCSVQFSPDGRWVATGSLDRTIKLWDVGARQEADVWRGHAGTVRAVVHSPDGKRVVSGGGDEALRVWDTQTGKEQPALQGHTCPVRALDVSPDGKRLLSASGDDTLRIWDSRTGQTTLTLEGHRDTALAARFSPDGTRLASGSKDRTLKVWDAATGKVLQTVKHSGPVQAVAWNRAGDRIFTGSSEKGIGVWDTQTGQKRQTLAGHADAVLALACSADGKRLVSGCADGTLKVWDARAFGELLTLTGHRGPVRTVAFSPDGARVVSGSEDRTLKVWDAETGQELLALRGHDRAVLATSWSPDGARIVSGSEDGTLRVWDAPPPQGSRDPVLLSEDRSVHWLEGKAHPCVYDERRKPRLWPLDQHVGAVLCVALSDDGKHLVTGGADGTARVWDLAARKHLRALSGHVGCVTAVRFSPDGARIFTGGDDATVKVWDAGNGQEVLTLRGHTGLIHSVAGSPDGARIVSCSADRTIKMWDARTGEMLLPVLGDGSQVQALLYAPDGKTIQAVDLADGGLGWDAATGQPLSERPPRGWLAVRERLFRNRMRAADLFPVGSAPPADSDNVGERLAHRRRQREYHRAEADAAEKGNLAHAAAFHLYRLAQLVPEERTPLLQRRARVLFAAFVQDPRDSQTVLRLARQTIADPATVPGARALLPPLASLAKQNKDATHRLHGAVLLRTGALEEAIVALEAARLRRGPDAPPLEELLLAVAVARLGQPEAARKHLQAATAWRERGRQPLRCAALVGNQVAGPLAALGMLPLEVPDPRLNPLDGQTAFELRTLTAEAEQAVGSSGR